MEKKEFKELGLKEQVDEYIRMHDTLLDFIENFKRGKKVDLRFIIAFKMLLFKFEQLVIEIFFKRQNYNCSPEDLLEINRIIRHLAENRVL